MQVLESERTVVTRKVLEKIKQNQQFKSEIGDCILKYMAHDWGDLCEEDKESNDKALKEGDRILAAYNTCEGKIWIITEWDRSVTTILFPDEY